MAYSWLIDGNCDECRRKNYCKTECRKGRERRRRKNYNSLMSLTPISSSMARSMGEQGYSIARNSGLLDLRGSNYIGGK